MADGMADGIGGAVDLFASFAQELANRAVMHAARREFHARYKREVVDTLLNPPAASTDQCTIAGSVNGVLLVIGVEEPRTVDLGVAPRYRRFLSLGIAGYGSDPIRVKREYFARPRLEALPQNNRISMRVSYFVWMDLSQAIAW